MSKEKQIRKITVNVGGLKGLTLTGTVESVKNNKLVTNTFADGVKHPVHRELEDKISDLRATVLEVCGLIDDNTKKDEKASLLGGCEIVSLEFERGATGYFKINATSRVFADKTQKLSTPKVELSDDYEYFANVMDTIEEILVEIDHYVNKTKVISDEDLMVSFVRHGKGKGIDMAAINEMSAEDKADWLQAQLEKMGCLVIRPDEIQEETEDSTEEVVIDLDGNFGEIFEQEAPHSVSSKL